MNHYKLKTELKPNNNKHSYEYIKEQFEKANYRLLSKEYKNALSKLEVECPNNHIYRVKFNDFQQGHRCDLCYRNRLRFDYEYVKNYIENSNYKLLSKEYKNSRSELSVECKNGHQYTTTWNRFQQGSRCPECIHNISKFEYEIYNLIQEHIEEEVFRNDRNQIKNPETDRFLELDIWIPSLRKAIEFNGMYWHEKENVKYRDNVKKEQCEDKKIDLLIVKEKDWLYNKNDSIKNIKIFLEEK